MFAKFDLPETIVTDNGTEFISQDFELFLKENRSKHVTSTPYNPVSNELTELAIQTVNRGLKKVTFSSITI